MSRVLIGSISRSSPAVATACRRPRRDSRRRWRAARASLASGRHQAGHRMQRAGSRARCAYSMARSTPARNSACAPGQAGEAPIAGGEVARHRVEQHLLQAVVVEALAQDRRRMVVGEEELDGLEAVRRSGGKAVQEFELRIEHRQVGGKAGHSILQERRPGVGTACRHSRTTRITGKLEKPRKRTRRSRTGSRSRARCRGNRASSRPTAMRASMRATFMPAQAWSPWPKARWRLGLRPTSKRSRIRKLRRIAVGSADA